MIISIEKCLKHIKNKFELVIIASKKAKKIISKDAKNNILRHRKSTILALREISKEKKSEDK